jgi:carboxylesterase
MIVGRAHTDRSGRLLGTDPGGPVLTDGRAPCIVAFHGFTGTTAELRPLLERFTKGGYAVRAPLLPGHGSSPARLQEATFEAWVAAMLEEVDLARQRHRRFVLCGFSLGSLVALELASRRPAGLRGLVVLGNALCLTTPVSATLAFVDRRGWQLPDWYLLKLWSSDIRDPEMKKRVVAYDRDPLRAALEVYRGGRRVETKLGSIVCPTLILHGAKDRVCPASNAKLVASKLGAVDVTTRVFPKSGHLVAADMERDDVAVEVIRFIERIT